MYLYVKCTQVNTLVAATSQANSIQKTVALALDNVTTAITTVEGKSAGR